MTGRALEYTVPVVNGRLPKLIERQIDDAIKNSDGKWLKITLQERKRRRSLNQNAYYWGVVIPHVMALFRDAGNDVDQEQVHDYLREHIGKFTVMVSLTDGTTGELLQHRLLGSTTALSTTEFEDYMEKVRAWAASMGCEIPLPNEGAYAN